MTRTERDVLTTYVDGIYNRRKKNLHDELYEKLNSYHTNAKLSVESNPSKFVDTEIIE